MFSVFLWIAIVPLFADIWLHDTGNFQYHIPDIAVIFIFTVRHKMFSLLYDESEADGCYHCLPFFLKSKETHLPWLPHHSWLLSVRYYQLFSFFFFLLFPFHLNTLYMMQFYNNLGNRSFSPDFSENGSQLIIWLSNLFLACSLNYECYYFKFYSRGKIYSLPSSSS